MNLKSNIQESLIHYLSDFSKSNLCKLKLLIEQQLKILNNHIYFSEIYNLYIDIIDFAVASKKPNIKNLDIYVFLKDITETNDKKLILYYLYEISFKISNNLLDRKAIALQCSNYLDEPLFYKMKLHAKSNGNFLDAYVYLAGKELPTINNLNVNHKYCLYNQLAFIQLNSNAYESSYETTKLCLNLVETYPDSFSDIQLLETYKKLGIICYTLHKYEEVVQYLLKPIEAGSTIGANYALFFHSLEKLNTITTIKNILNMIDLNKIGNQNEKIVLVYYKMKYETNELTKNRMCDLEDYICLNLGPALKNIGEIHEQIFFDDLKFYISKTANYKKLFTFQK